MKPLRAAMHAYEAKLIAAALRDHDGNVTETAKALDISRREMQRKMNEHELHEMAATLRAKAGVSGPR